MARADRTERPDRGREATRQILVFGGYGGFGGRLSRRLAAAGHAVLVAGRHAERAEWFCAGVAGCRPVTADRRDAAATIARLAPALVIDAAGPFQDGDAALPRACIAVRVPYLDLADARGFVTTIGTLDEAARAAGVAVIAGASSVPALSGAVVRALTEGLQRVTAIDMAISASNRASAGRSVATAILSYVGRPVAVWRHRRTCLSHGWQELGNEVFALADGTQLGRRLVAVADIPDLTLLPGRVRGAPAVRFRAGTELSIQMTALWLASWPVRWRWLRSLAGLAGMLLPLQSLTGRFGGDRSGMVVRLFGTTDGGSRVERRWTLIAGQGRGPEIPTLAAALLAERIVAGELPPGARDAGELLDLTDFAPAFEELGIRHETLEIVQPAALYHRVMGDRFDDLAPMVRALHSVLRDDGWAGRAVVTRGRHPLARLVAAVMRFPPAGEHPLHVDFSERAGIERWTRRFGGHRFTSELSQLGDRLVERFGPFRFVFELLRDGNGLRMSLCRWSFIGMRLPLALAPRSDAREWEEGGMFRFDVPIGLPLVGPVVHYRGWLQRPEYA